MISFIKFLKIVLPIISATTATLTTASLVSRKKHDPDENAKSKEINLNSFVTVDENFKERLMLYAKEGTGENVSVEDAEKAQKLIDNLKNGFSEGDLPDFKSAEEAMKFLEEFPEKILSDLLKGSNLSQEELSKLFSSKFGKEGKLGEVLKSPQFNFGQNMNYPQGSDMQGNISSTDGFDALNNDLSNPPKMSMNFEGTPDFKLPDLDSEQVDQVLNIQQPNVDDIDQESLNEIADATELLSEVGNSILQNMSPLSVPQIEANSITTPKIPDVQINIKFPEKAGGLSFENSERPDNENGREPLDSKEQQSPVGDDTEVSREIQEDILKKTPPVNDSYETTNEIPDADFSSKNESELTEPAQNPETQNSKEDKAPSKFNDVSPQLSMPDLFDMRPGEAIKLDLEIPALPNIVLPDLSSLQDIFSDLFKNNPFGTEGSKDKLSLGDLKRLASSVSTTEKKLDNLIKSS